MLFFELREEVKALLKELDYDLPKQMEPQEFNQMLGYLSDIFTRMNDLSVSIRGKHVNILKCREKLNLWRRRVKRGSLLSFSSPEETVDEYVPLIPSVCEDIVDHLEILSKSFGGYFGGDLETSEEWIINPYSFN